MTHIFWYCAFAFIYVGGVFACLNPFPGCHELDCHCGNFWLYSLVLSFTKWVNLRIDENL